MQERHSAKGTLQGLGFAESIVNTFEQSAKFYWRMWGPLGEPMVRTVDTWAGMQRSYLQWLREASVAGDRDAAQRIAREAERDATTEAEEAGPSEEITSVVRESVRRSEEGSWNQEQQGGTTT